MKDKKTRKRSAKMTMENEVIIYGHLECFGDDQKTSCLVTELV